MPTPLNLPYPPLILLDLDGEVDSKALTQSVESRLGAGASFCLRQSAGDSRRGGYFFHLRKVDSAYVFSSFARAEVVRFQDWLDCLRFINHVSGRKFDSDMWSIVAKANLRKDEYTN